MDIREHHLEEMNNRLCCTRCLREWSQLRTTQRWCPGVPWYSYGSAPDHLYTYSQLMRVGLKPRSRAEHVGCIVMAFHNVVPLYDIREALPRRGETQRQRAARLAAWPHIQEKYMCEHCGYMPATLSAFKYKMQRAGLCLACKEQLDWQQEQDAQFVQMAVLTGYTERTMLSV